MSPDSKRKVLWKNVKGTNYKRMQCNRYMLLKQTCLEAGLFRIMLGNMTGRLPAFIVLSIFSLLTSLTKTLSTSLGIWNCTTCFSLPGQGTLFEPGVLIRWSVISGWCSSFQPFFLPGHPEVLPKFPTMRTWSKLLNYAIYQATKLLTSIIANVILIVDTMATPVASCCRLDQSLQAASGL